MSKFEWKSEFCTGTHEEMDKDHKMLLGHPAMSWTKLSGGRITFSAASA